jgi:ATP-dependent Lon protease
MAEAVFERHSHALSSAAFVIIPSPPEATAWPGEAPPAVGALATLYRCLQVEPGEDYRMTVRTLARVRLRGLASSEHGALARIAPLEDIPCAHPQAQLDRLRYRLNDYIRSTPDMRLEEALSLRDPVFLADFIAANLELSQEERRALLEELDPEARIAWVCAWLDRELLEPPRPPQDSRFYVTPVRFAHAWDE